MRGSAWPWRDLGRIPGEPVVVLRGPMATPAQVRRAMTRAAVIEIHAHGLVGGAISDAASAVLAGDADGNWAMTARDVRAARLSGSPLVILAACHAAKVAPYTYQTWSLPAVFRAAGARTIIASQGAIGDGDAEAFFAEVRARIHAGASAAVAVRDQRVRVMAPDSWQSQVIVFE